MLLAQLLPARFCFCLSDWLGNYYGGRNTFEIANQMTYSFLSVALLPYAIGAWLWHHQKCFSNFHAIKTRLLASAQLLIAPASGLSRVSITLAYLAALPILALIAAMLAGDDRMGNCRQVDNFFGHMSYPIYHTHGLCALLVLWACPNRIDDAIYQLNKTGMVVFTPLGFGVVTLVTLLLSVAIAIGFEIPIERHRRALAKRFGRALISCVHNAGWASL